MAVEAAGIDLIQGFLYSRPLTDAGLLAAGFLEGRTPVVSFA